MVREGAAVLVLSQAVSFHPERDGEVRPHGGRIQGMQQRVLLGITPEVHRTGAIMPLHPFRSANEFTIIAIAGAVVGGRAASLIKSPVNH